MRKRSVWVEPLFAEGKQWHGMRRYRLRRLWRVNCEALIRAAGQNLKRLLKKRGWRRRPWPAGAANALSEPSSEELIPLHAPSLPEKALAYGEKVRMKGLLKPLPVLGIPLVFAPSLARRRVSSSHEDSTVSRPLWLSSVCLWLARCIFLDKAGIRDRKSWYLSLSDNLFKRVFQQAALIYGTNARNEWSLLTINRLHWPIFLFLLLDEEMSSFPS